MNRKVILTTRTLILLSIIAVTMVSFSYAIEWSPDQRLTFHDDIDWNPSITSTITGELWLVWRSDRMGNDDIFYKIFNGSTWSEDTQLTTDPNTDDHPAIMEAADETIWVVWDSNRTRYGEKLFYKVFNGSTWTEDMQLTADHLYADVFPSIMQASDGKIWVVWTSNRIDLQCDLFYKVFNGSSWSDDTRLTTDPEAEDLYPSLMQTTDGMIWVAFSRTFIDKHGRPHEDIYIKIYNGTAWYSEEQFTFDDLHCESQPSIMQTSNGSIWVVWDSDLNTYDENLYYRVFNGSVWSADIKLTTHLADDMGPSIVEAVDKTIWVVWCSIRQANIDIYYKTKAPPPNHDVAIASVTTSKTIAVRSEIVSIQVIAQNQGTYIETFEVRCYANLTLIGSRTICLSPGQTQKMYPFCWNTTGVPRGKHIITAVASAVPQETDSADNSKRAKEAVEIRVMGDICGMYNRIILPIPDGVVGIDDFMIIAMPGHIWTQEPDWDPIWGPVCDIDNDGRVGISDLMIVGIHFGET